MRLCIAAIATLPVVLSLLCAGAAQAQWRGHGGPVKALAIAPDGESVLSGSFDSSAIRWSTSRQAAQQVLRFHESAVNAVAILKDGRLVTGGEDGRVAIWVAGEPVPASVLSGHTAPVVALAVSPDGGTIASASWDRSVKLWPAGGGTPRVLEGHQDNVNGAAFTPDGGALVTAGYDATLRIWPIGNGGAATVLTLPTPLNAVAVAPDGEIVVGGADGRLFFLSPAGERLAELEAGSSPIIALAVSPDGKRLAAAGIRGAVAVIDRPSRALVRTLVGPGLPVWSAAFAPDSKTLFTGGSDRMIRRWDAENGEHIGAVAVDSGESPLAAFAGDPGAEVYKACIACHTLGPDEGNRAGPTLAGIFGRRIATLPGYNFSDALKKLDIVWTPETIARLFEVGPATYTPGTKMPEQTIGSAQDREALVRFLEKATKLQR